MIRIGFDFKDRKAEDIEQLNAILATMKLEELRLENFRGYLATTTDGDGNLIGRRYGPDSGELVCKLSEDGDRYVMDTVVVDRCVAHEEFMQIWRDNHPDRIVRTVIRAGYDTVVGYLIAHHQRG